MHGCMYGSHKCEHILTLESTHHAKMMAHTIIFFCYYMYVCICVQVLSTLEIDAFEFFKIISLFITANPELPVSLQDHLYGVEEQILESVCWKSGSPIFAQLHPVPLPTHYSYRTKHTHKIPIFLPINSIIHLPSLLPTQAVKLNAATEMFMRKVLILTSSRCHDLCVTLSVPSPMRDLVWTAIQVCCVTW